MSSSHVDCNLLFGFLALQNNFIDRENLIAAVSAWLVDKSRQLGDIMRERKLLAEDEYELIKALAAKQLQRHDNDPEKTLGAFTTLGVLPRELRQLGDPELDTSLNHFLTATSDASPQIAETLPSSVSQETSSRFRIMRPHAKGGLGQVFVARDLELNRDVALKEILFHHADDLNSRARFVLEAEITGGLEHPGIVPVYGLGQYPDGRPFYAMRFIRGDSLKESIERFHAQTQRAHGFESVSFRGLVSRFVNVCNAIEYAHSRGVLHRDLKPGNIMLGRYGETLVVDWGLAKARGRDDLHSTTDEQTLQPRSSSGSAATQMGSAVGTPAYMSPEQAAGRLDRVGPASDVYSLGATLYFMLTGKNPFAKADAMTVLRRVQAGDFPPPRALVPTLPKPLEAICLKAMALSPSDRYPTAVALANDLERWLADEPIEACPESWSDRARRWGRRHRTLVRVSTVAIAVIAVVATAATIAVDSERREKVMALKRAEDYYLVARNSVDRWLTGVSEALQYAPGTGAMRERLLKASAEDFLKFSQYESSDPDMEVERGRALLRLGEVQRDLGDFSAASTTFSDAEAHFEQLAQRLPAAAQWARIEQGRARNRRGALLNVQDDPRALEVWRSAVKLLESPLSGVDTDWNRRLVLATSHVSISGWLERAGQMEAALKEADAALSVLPVHEVGGESGPTMKPDQLVRTRLEALRRKARIQSVQGQWTEARELLKQAINSAAALGGKESDNPRQLLTLADTQLELAGVLRQLGLYEEELVIYGLVLPSYRKLLDVIPDNPEFREALAFVLLDRAQLLTELHRLREANRDLDEATSVIARLTTQYPQVSQYQQELAAALEGRGTLSHLAGDFSDARIKLQQAIEIYERLGEARPDVPAYREREAVARVQLARTLEALKQPGLADAEFSTALANLTELRSLAPEHPQFAMELAWLHKHRGVMLWDRGPSERATAELQTAIEAWREIVTKWTTTGYERSYAELLANCPAADLRDGNQALELARRGIAAAPTETLSRSLLAAALYRAGKPQEALKALNEWNVPSGPLAGDCFIKALSLSATGDTVAAQRSFDQGLSLLQQRPGDEDLRRLASETADKLGLKVPESR